VFYLDNKVFFERDTFNKVVDLEVGNSHVIKTLWHPKLNQVNKELQSEFILRCV